MRRNLEIPQGKRTKAYRFFEILPGLISYGAIILLFILSATPAPSVRPTWQVHLDPSFSLLQGDVEEMLEFYLDSESDCQEPSMCVRIYQKDPSLASHSLKRGQDPGMGLESLKCKGKQDQHQQRCW